MEIATVRRTLNHTLTELKRALDRHAVADAADLYALAWQQAAGAPPSETREQRAQLKAYKEVLGSRQWREEERRQAATVPSTAVVPRPKQAVASVPRTRPEASRASDSVVPPSGRTATPPTAPRRPSAPPQAPAPVTAARPSRGAEPKLLETGRLWEIATELRPLLEQTARSGATTTWPQIHKRLPGLPRLHADDQGVILWLVDEDGREGEPLLCALVTVGDRQMHPRFPAVAEQLGWSAPAGTRQHTAWSYEVLKVRQHWRHRR
ncbi:hypothetical protein ACWCQL_09765 [Streptomyces sp. NPDC002073]